MIGSSDNQLIHAVIDRWLYNLGSFMNTIYQIGSRIQSLFGRQHIGQAAKYVREINQFRKQPAIVIPYLNQRKQNYSLDKHAHLLFSPNHPNKALQTIQGKSPIYQLQTTLHSLTSSLPTLAQNPFLSIIAQHLASTFTNIHQLSQINLTQSHSKSLRVELNNSAEYDFVDGITCLIGVGFDGDGYQPLVSLLVDDGCKERRNRQVLLSKSMRFVGIGTTRLKHRQELRVVVYLLTGNILNK